MIDFDSLLLDKFKARRRLVTIDDAEFITALRSDKKLAKHIHYNDGDVKKQIEWIKRYKEREAIGKEFYFIHESVDGEKFGTTRLSDFDDHSCVMGSWLFKKDSPMGLSVVSDCYLKQTAFSIPEIVYLRFDVRKLNTFVVRYHASLWESQKITEDDINNYYILTKEKYESQLKNILELCNIE